MYRKLLVLVVLIVSAFVLGRWSAGKEATVRAGEPQYYAGQRVSKQWGTFKAVDNGILYFEAADGSIRGFYPRTGETIGPVSRF